MVCNIFKILDENEIKQLSIIDYNMVKPKHIYDFEYLITQYKYEKLRLEASKERMITTNSAGGQEWSRGYNQTTYDQVCREYHDHLDVFKEKYMDEMDMNGIHGIPKIYWNSKEICDFMGIIPFVPSVMINISPDWKEMKNHKNKVNVLKDIIDNYMKEQWYEKWEYVIENGSDGKHIHAHLVAQMNSNRLKSVESHLKKGNHTQQLKKYAKKIKGMEGIIKGNSVQKIFLRTEEIVKDKLLYLHEDTKPEGHKNKSVIKNGYVCGCL